MTEPAPREHRGFFADERHSRSMGRVLLVVVTAFILLLIVAQTFWLYKVSGEAWTILGAMESAFTIWVAGPRIAQYLLPAAQAGLQALRDVVAARRANGQSEYTP